MSLEQQVANLVEASNNLTGSVNGKIGEIDSRMDKAESDLDEWKATTSYVQKYSVGYAEDYYEDSQSGNYHLIQLYVITNAYSALNPWIHIGFTGGNCVGAAQFCSLAQSHAGYTGQQAMSVKRGGGDIRFFIDRTSQSPAPVYMALKNDRSNNANVMADIASYMSLDVSSQGAKDIDTWLAANPNVVEIDLIDITTQPAA